MRKFLWKKKAQKHPWDSGCYWGVQQAASSSTCHLSGQQELRTDPSEGGEAQSPTNPSICLSPVTSSPGVPRALTSYWVSQQSTSGRTFPPLSRRTSQLDQRPGITATGLWRCFTQFSSMLSDFKGLFKTSEHIQEKKNKSGNILISISYEMLRLVQEVLAIPSKQEIFSSNSR